jgi:hypothetical protein
MWLNPNTGKGWTDSEEQAFAQLQATGLTRIRSIQLWKRFRRDTTKALAHAQAEAKDRTRTASATRARINANVAKRPAPAAIGEGRTRTQRNPGKGQANSQRIAIPHTEQAVGAFQRAKTAPKPFPAAKLQNQQNKGLAGQPKATSAPCRRSLKELTPIPRKHSTYNKAASLETTWPDHNPLLRQTRRDAHPFAHPHVTSFITRIVVSKVQSTQIHPASGDRELHAKRPKLPVSPAKHAQVWAFRVNLRGKSLVVPFAFPLKINRELRHDSSWRSDG